MDNASQHRILCSLSCSLLAFGGMKNAHHMMFMLKRKSGYTLVYTKWKHKGKKAGRRQAEGKYWFASAKLAFSVSLHFFALPTLGGN